MCELHIAQAHKLYVHLEMVRTEILIVIYCIKYLIDVRFILGVLSEYVFSNGYRMVLY